MSETDERTAKKRIFLEKLAEGESITGACKLAEVGRSTVYEWRELDESFRLGWEEALESSTEVLEREGFRRAVDGSDTLLIFLLKSRRPEVYRDRYEGPPPRKRKPRQLENLSEEELENLEQILHKLEAPEPA